MPFLPPNQQRQSTEGTVWQLQHGVKRLSQWPMQVDGLEALCHFCPSIFSFWSEDPNSHRIRSSLFINNRHTKMSSIATTHQHYIMHTQRRATRSIGRLIMTITCFVHLWHSFCCKLIWIFVADARLFLQFMYLLRMVWTLIDAPCYVFYSLLDC